MANWLDKYDNAPKAENGIEGTMGGLTDVGFNYNGAWGGTMQNGGLTFLEPTSRKLPKGYVIPYNTPSTELAMSIGGVGNEPAYLIPSFKYGRLLEDPISEFRKTGEHLGGPFKTYQEADEWERTVRHPYVEKGQSIPTPLKRWGKDFAMGGSIPGAVGFTYARVSGAAPSNGPYAKKTKASAQNGMEMKYYQEGLDFKPKNISQDGKKLKLLLTQSPKGDMESYYPELKKIKEAPKMAETKKAAADRANLERAKRKATYVKPGPSEAQSRINRQQATELAKQEALQNSPLAQTLGSFTPSGYNPGAGAVGAETFVNMAPGISIIPSSVRLGQLYKGNDPYGFDQENIISSENALASLGALGDVANVALPTKLGVQDWLRGYKEVPKYVSSPVQNIFSKRFEQLNDQLRFLGLPELNNPNATKVLENFRKRIQTPEGQKRLKDLGITNTKVLDDLTIVGDENTLGRYWMNKIGLNPNLPEVKRVTRHEIEHAVQDAIESSRMNKYKQDANNLKYLFRPKAKKKAIEAAMKPTSEIDDMLGGLELRKTPEKVDWDKIKETRGKREPSELFNYMSDKQRATNYFDSGSGGKEKSAFLSEVQQYMMDEGIIPKTSYVEVTPEMVKETFMNTMFDEKGGKYLRLFNIMKPNEANYKLVSDALNKMLTVVPVVGGAAAATSQLEQKEKGGKIKKDSMGYWNPENWGEPVEIDSNQITMEGVYEPLLGISDTGDVQMMYPGEDYTFDGETVTEYPIAKSGMSVNNADAQPIEKLDQLLNFTNYNKPTKGGWLEKYEEGGEISSDIKYDIQKGDTLSNISSRYNVPLATLANANNLQNPNLIQAGKKLNIPTQAKKELTFEEIPTSDNKKVVIDNYSKHYDYIVEGNSVYYKTKGGKTWADISDNKTAQSNLLKFLDKNDYWKGYESGEKELLKTGQVPNKQQAQVDLPKLTPIKTRAAADATQVAKSLTKPVSKSTTKEEPSVFDDMTNYLKSEVKSIGGKAKKLDKQVESTIGEVKSSVESGVNKAVQTVEDLYQTGINGIKRKIATHTGEDDDVKVETPKINKPKTVSEYYGNKTGAEISAVVDVPDGSGRQYKQQVLPVSSIKFGVRNRGEYKDIKTDGLEITTFNPFTKDKLPDNTTVLAIDPSGNLHTGVYKDFKNQKGFMFSKTFRNKIVDFAESNGKAEYVSGEKSGNPKYNQPKVKVMNDNGKIVDGSLNVLVKDDSKKDYYGSIQGGRILFVNPETKEQYLVSGSVSHIKNEFKRIKGNSKYLEAYTLDNGTYSRGLSYKDKKLTPERLKKYDLENTGGGNGLFIVDYKQPISKFREEYVEGMPNVRTEKDESYKKGHPLRNEIKNIVLHHTAYTGPNAEKEVTAQYMTPGQNTSHIVIQKDGRRTVYASPEQVTFHAGESKWNNRDNVNDFSIGVEFQGDTNKKPLTQAQVESFVEYYIPIAKKYNLSLKDMITHQMVAPGRKPDISEKEYQRILKYMRDNNLK